MPLYFFNTMSIDLHVQDDEGVECASLFEVKKLARRVLCEMAAHSARDEDRQTFTVEVYDRGGTQIHTSSLQIDAS